MILNKHILPNWQKFLESNEIGERPYALCGRRTLPKYTGIPGIDDEPPFVTDGAGRQVPGWCHYCAYKALKVCQSVLATESNSYLLHLYKDAAEALAMSLSVH